MPSYHPGLPQGHTSDLMTDLDREVIIHACKMFLSQIEAIVEVSGDFIEQMCV
jgi:hypothetical protein